MKRITCCTRISITDIVRVTVFAITKKGDNQMKNFGLIMMVLGAFALSACQTLENRGNKELIGGASGAVIGGILGSKVGGGSGQRWATGAGVLIGALIGSDIGASLDAADRAAMGQAQTQAYDAPVGETISWNNPDSGNSGSYTPTKDGYSSSGRYCREYTQEIIIGGQREQGVGTACQNPDGSWEIIS